MPRALIVAWIGVAWVAGLVFGWWTAVDGRIDIIEAFCVVGLTIVMGVSVVLDYREPQEQ
jgi:hypothetical protein